MLLPGEVLISASRQVVRKSAEAIVGLRNELLVNGRGLTDKLKG